MNLKVDELKENYDKLIEIINKNFTGDRKEKLLKMYDDLGERMLLAPASSYNYFHGAFPGGYVIHVLNVVKIIQTVYKLWKHYGAYTDDYTFEELIFVALNHDLGKIGNPEHEFYLPNDSDWHIKNQGKYYS